MHIPAIATALGAMAALSACATTTPPPTGLAPAMVTASGETVPVGTINRDAADDPAIWRNAADPAQSLIVATDKRAGLYVYGIDGQQRSFAGGGRLNNVDLVEAGDAGIVVVASDRNNPEAKLQVYSLDPGSAELMMLGTLRVGPGRGYGLCLTYRGGELRAYSPVKEGQIYEQRILVNESGASAEALRTLSVPSQPEGCVVDQRDGTLYVGEEDGGIWRFGPEAEAGELVAPVDNRYLVADVEGLDIAPSGENGGYLVASSQGDNSFAVFRLPDMAPVGRFAIAKGAYGAVEGTDGIALALGDFGPDYPQGLFVAQDGKNPPAAQNFKLVSWAAIREALGLD